MTKPKSKAKPTPVRVQFPSVLLEILWRVLERTALNRWVQKSGNYVYVTDSYRALRVQLPYYIVLKDGWYSWDSVSEGFPVPWPVKNPPDLPSFFEKTRRSDRHYIVSAAYLRAMTRFLKTKLWDEDRKLYASWEVFTAHIGEPVKRSLARDAYVDGRLLNVVCDSGIVDIKIGAHYGVPLLLSWTEAGVFDEGEAWIDALIMEVAGPVRPAIGGGA